MNDPILTKLFVLYVTNCRLKYIKKRNLPHELWTQVWKLQSKVVIFIKERVKHTVAGRRGWRRTAALKWDNSGASGICWWADKWTVSLCWRWNLWTSGSPTPYRKHLYDFLSWLYSIQLWMQNHPKNECCYCTYFRTFLWNFLCLGRFWNFWKKATKKSLSCLEIFKIFFEI